MADIEKKFPSEIASRGTVLVTDKLLIHNITTGATEYTTVAALLKALSTFAAGQIGFPATQIPSSNVNTLDDYKEGTWTPWIYFGGSTTGMTYSVQSGWYTKIGNLVTVGGNLTFTNKGSATGYAFIMNLPYNINADSYAAASFHIQNITYANQIQGRGVLTGAAIYLEEVTEAGVMTPLTDANFANDSVLQFSLTYRV